MQTSRKENQRVSRPAATIKVFAQREAQKGSDEALARGRASKPAQHLVDNLTVRWTISAQGIAMVSLRAMEKGQFMVATETSCSGSSGRVMPTFGPDYDEHRDGERLREQRERVKNVLLAAAIRNQWLTVEEICQRLEARYRMRFPVESIGADVRHLRKQQFGGYHIPSRKRVIDGKKQNYSEFRIFAEVKLAEGKQYTLLEIGAQNYREEVRQR